MTVRGTDPPNDWHFLDNPGQSDTGCLLTGAVADASHRMDLPAFAGGLCMPPIAVTVPNSTTSTAFLPVEGPGSTGVLAVDPEEGPPFAPPVEASTDPIVTIDALDTPC